MSRHFLAPIAMLLSLAFPALANASDASSACVGELLSAGKIGDLGLATIIADERVHFQADPSGCSGQALRCQKRAYLVKGNSVVTGQKRGDWICVLYPNNNGGNEGWVRFDKLAATSTSPAPTSSGWAGDWARDAQASVNLTAAGQNITVDGSASWEGSNPGQVNSGELAGRSRPHGDTLFLADEDSCKATLRLLGPYLLVADDNECGGLNVSFDGAYRRSAKGRAGQ